MTESAAVAGLSTTLQTRHCPICRDIRAMEQPPCPDHDECPEWICIDCGSAIFGSWLPAETRPGLTRAASIA